MFDINSKVTRKSHENDVVFTILKIENGVAYLKGCDVRLYADSPLSDLEISDRNDDFIPLINNELNDRDEFFYLPGKILHLDGDIDYLNKSLKFYKDSGVYAIGKQISEDKMYLEISNLLNEYKPDILVITGHDAYFSKNGDHLNINAYKNSFNFVKCVMEARKFEKSHEKLVIIAGACQSDYEALIKCGANFASSPKRVNIHALDPAIIAISIAKAEKGKIIDIKELLSKTKYGKYGIGGLVGSGMMYVGYPR